MYISQGPDVYQTHKIYVQNIVETGPESSIERLLASFFSLFGHIVDIKVLRNCPLTSSQQTLRLRFLRRRRKRAPHPSLFFYLPGKKSDLSSLKSLGPRWPSPEPSFRRHLSIPPKYSWGAFPSLFRPLNSFVTSPVTARLRTSSCRPTPSRRRSTADTDSSIIGILSR